MIDISVPARPVFKTELTYKPQAEDGFAALSRVFIGMREKVVVGEPERSQSTYDTERKSIEG